METISILFEYDFDGSNEVISILELRGILKGVLNELQIYYDPVAKNLLRGPLHFMFGEVLEQSLQHNEFVLTGLLDKILGNFCIGVNSLANILVSNQSVEHISIALN